MILESITTVVQISYVKQWRVMGITFFSTQKQDSQHNREICKRKCWFFIPVFDSASAVDSSAAAGLATSNSEKQCASFQMQRAYIFQLGFM